MTSVSGYKGSLSCYAFSQCRAEVLCRHELATNELLMMGCQDCCEERTGSVRSQQQWPTTATMGAEWRKISTKEEYSVAKKTSLLCPLSQTGKLWVFVFINKCPNMPSLANDSLRRPSEHFY